MELHLEYKGKWVSVNELRNNHRWKAQALKEKYRPLYARMIMDELLKEGLIGERFESFKVEIKYNSRLDADNVTLKYLCDALKDCRLIIDDNKKYFRGFSIEPDESLPIDTYRIKIWQP